MGRDGVLPKRIFGKLDARFDTPVFSILLVAAVGLIATFLDVATSTSFVNFGAFIAFTMVNVCVVFSYARASESERKERFRGGVLLNIICPLIGAACCAYLLLHLDVHAVALGLSWLAIGIVILAVLTKGFRQNPPEYGDA